MARALPDLSRADEAAVHHVDDFLMPCRGARRVARSAGTHQSQLPVGDVVVTNTGLLGELLTNAPWWTWLWKLSNAPCGPFAVRPPAIACTEPGVCRQCRWIGTASAGAALNNVMDSAAIRVKIIERTGSPPSWVIS